MDDGELPLQFLLLISCVIFIFVPNFAFFSKQVIIIFMSFFSCTGKSKKKYIKFGLVDMFREPVKPTKQL